MEIESCLVEVNIIKIIENEIKFLLMKRSKEEKYPGVWQMVTGHIEKGETAKNAAIRETLEETGLHATNLWSIPHLNSFYNPETDTIEMPPQVPVIVRAEFKSPIDKTRKVAVGALVDPTDQEEKGKVGRIIMIDAALRLEGEKSGEIVEGIGAAIGDPGPEKLRIEEVATRYKIPLDSIIVKESLEEAITTMKKEIAEAADLVIERIKEIVRNRTNIGDVVLIAGIGNSMGIAQ